MTQETSERVVEKSVTVSVPVERAFEVFTAEIGTWWPLRTHAVDTERSETVVMEGRVGGKALRAHAVRRGARLGHARRLGAAQPHRLLLAPRSRRKRPPRRSRSPSSPEGDGTRVDIRHYGWERLGDRLEDAIASYTEGWDKVIGRYVGRREELGARTPQRRRRGRNARSPRHVVHELEVDHEGRVSLARPDLHDSRVAAGPLREARCDLGEEDVRDLLGTEERDSLPVGGDVAALAERDHLLDDRADLLGLGLGGLDAPVLDQRRGEVGVERLPVRRVATELPTRLLVPQRAPIRP